MSRTGSHLKIRALGTKVLGVELEGNPKKPEPESFRVMFPGGDVDVCRTEDGGYWIHVRVERPESCTDPDVTMGRLTEARLDLADRSVTEADLGDFGNPSLYHLAVRIERDDRGR